jgi:hypothetical protein
MGGSQANSQAKKVTSRVGKNKPLLGQGKIIQSNNTPTRNKARGGNKEENNKESKNSTECGEDPMVEDARTPLHGKVVSTGKGKEGGREQMEVDEGVGSPFQGVRLNDKFQEEGPQEQLLVLYGWWFAAKGVFPDINEGLDPHLGLASDLYMGRNTLTHLLYRTRGSLACQSPRRPTFLMLATNQARRQLKKLIASRLS